MRILLADNDKRNATYLRRGLVEHGFSVDLAPPGNWCPDVPLGLDYDLLITAAPRESSNFEVPTGRIPTLFLLPGRTADVPDNCLERPFSFTDLLSKVRLLQRRRAGYGQTLLSIADLELDLLRRRVTRGGRRLDLTPKEFLLLGLLMSRSGEVLSRTLISDQVWDVNFDSNTNFLAVHIRRLRAKVDDPFDRKLIHTVRGIGYVLEDRPIERPRSQSSREDSWRYAEAFNADLHRRPPLASSSSGDRRSLLR